MSEARHCFICRNYTYWGTIISRANGDVILGDCYIIYDTGKWSDPEWKIAEYLGNWRVNESAVESWGATTKALPGQASYEATQGKTITAGQSASQSSGIQAGGGVDEPPI